MIKGSIVALVTPMNKNGSIDLESFEKLILRQIEAGTQGIVVFGSTGESASLSQKEKLQLLEFAKKIINNKMVLIASTGLSSTFATIELSNMAIEKGADACLVVTPFYNRPTQEGLYQHYKKVSQDVLGPIIMYNVPSRTGTDLLPETVARLSSFKNIIAIKEAHPDISRVSKLVKLCGNDILYYCGNDNMNLDFAFSGGDGCISVTANIVPELMNSMYRAFFAKNFAKAEKINSQMRDLNDAMSLEPNPIPVKWALYKMGLIKDGIRLPLTRLSEKYQDSVEKLVLEEVV